MPLNQSDSFNYSEKNYGEKNDSMNFRIYLTMQKKIPGPVQQWGVTVKKWVYFLYCTNVLAVVVNVMHCDSIVVLINRWCCLLWCTFNIGFFLTCGLHDRLFHKTFHKLSTGYLYRYVWCCSEKQRYDVWSVLVIFLIGVNIFTCRKYLEQDGLYYWFNLSFSPFCSLVYLIYSICWHFNSKDVIISDILVWEIQTAFLYN